DQSGFKTQAGQPALSSQAVNFIKNIITQCHGAKVPVASLTLPKTAQELDFKAADRPYFVKFYLGGDPVLETGQFLAARHRFDQTGQPTSYLDVRVNGKIYFN